MPSEKAKTIEANDLVIMRHLREGMSMTATAQAVFNEGKKFGGKRFNGAMAEVKRVREMLKNGELEVI